MNATLAVIPLVQVFAVVGVIGLRFMAGETRRFHEERDELERQHREVVDAADRALRRLRTYGHNVN